MKRYLIFAPSARSSAGSCCCSRPPTSPATGPTPTAGEVAKLFVVFAKTLQYSYLFGIVPALMLGAIDDILLHVRRIGPVVRMLIVGVIGFAAAELLYGSRGPDTGVVQFILYGLVGFVPATLSSWLAHKYAEEPQAVNTA